MKIKVCGLKHQSNVHQVMNLNPDYLGFIFYEKSPRYIGGLKLTLNQMGLDAIVPDELNWISELMPIIPKVGVFVNSSVYTVEKTAEFLGLDIVQMHGDEKPSDCAALQLKGLEVWKAFPVNADFSFDETIPYEKVCNKFLFDAKGAGRGGNGVGFDWNLLEGHRSRKPFLLSGGIGPEHATFFQNEQNLGWLESQGMVGIDINSRFETEPGLKDIELIKKFKHELYA